MTATKLNRNEISEKAWTLGKRAEGRMITAFDGTAESEKLEQEWATLSFHANRLNNDTCECAYKVAALRERLIELEKQFEELS